MTEKPGPLQACRQTPYAIGSSLKGADTSQDHTQLTLPNVLMNTDTNKSEDCQHTPQLFVRALE